MIEETVQKYPQKQQIELRWNPENGHASPAH